MRGQQVGRGGAPGRAHQQAEGGGGGGRSPAGRGGHTDGGGRADQHGGVGEGRHAPAIHPALPLQVGQPRHRAENQF